MATASQIDALNRAVATRALQRADGATVTESFDVVLLTRDGRTAYRIDDGIPVMLADLAVSTRQIDGFPE